ncbi:MAG: adenylate/guanylate cyclase domain-containing protein [Acidobacteria bacterium]|nr:adenylate/guanylate cyclase domain-containing protein [Acidobacteriota bacterium]
MMPAGRLTRLAPRLLLALAASLVAAGLSLTGFADTIELKTYDWRVRQTTADRLSPSSPVIVVAIDDESLRRMEPLVGRWPWPRLVHALVVDYLAAAGARAVVYDVLFAEGDRRTFMVGETEWTGQESDQALVDSTRAAGMVVHAAEAASSGARDAARALPVDVSVLPDRTARLGHTACVEGRPQTVLPFPELAQASAGVGHSLMVYDADGPLRRVVPLVSVERPGGGPVVLPSLPLAAVLLAQGLTGRDLTASPTHLRAGALDWPLMAGRLEEPDGTVRTTCRALLPWAAAAVGSDGTAALPRQSFYDLFLAQQELMEGVTPSVAPAQFRDKVVVVGVTAQGLHDVFTTPFTEGKMAGPEVHAQTIDAMLGGRQLVQAPRWQALGAMVALTLLVSVVGALSTVWVAGAVALVTGGAWVWGTVVTFGGGVWWPMVMPLAALGLAFVGDLGWHYVVEGRERRKVTRLFSRYVSKAVYQQLLEAPQLAQLGGTRRFMTVLFSDMRGFTSLTERESPEAMVAQLNDYFTRMVALVFAHQGTLDKFVGDMVMALYGAPVDDEAHADHAVQTALAMVRALAALNAERATRGAPPFDIGIGINSGEMVAGNIGSDQVMSYTVIGDAVNLGARLESLNKEYGTRIIISEATRALLRGQYDVRPLGTVTVKGKTQPAEIFEVRA